MNQPWVSLCSPSWTPLTSLPIPSLRVILVQVWCMRQDAQGWCTGMTKRLLFKQFFKKFWLFCTTYGVLVPQPVTKSAPQWTVSLQLPLSLGCFKQEYWSGLPFPPPGDSPSPGVKRVSPALQADSFPTEPSRKPEGPLQWEHKSLTTGPPGKAQRSYF